ncbi:hypothetical protein F4604DRAFT_1926467 [Suillus subluteus]|nr:hypothetical protein F4604DRAFT_1926467 [Suillus subluteus]
MSGRRGSQRKGKAAIPKPPRGSGLNPSGLPAADQLNLPAEQPRMSAFNFNPYDQSVGGWQGQGAQQNAEGQDSMSFRGGEGSSSFSHAQGSMSFGGGEGSFSHAQGSSYRYRQGSSSYADEEVTDFYNHFQDIPLDSGPPFSDFLSDHPGQAAPMPRWIEEAPDRGASIADRCGGVNFSFGGGTWPARMTWARTAQRANMPATPYPASQTPVPITEVPTQSPVTELIDAQHEESSSSHTVIKLTKEHVMMSSRAQRKRMINEIIESSVPQFYRPNAKFQSFITNAHRRQVGNTLSAKRGKIAEFAREGVCHEFQLFPPQGHPSLPTQYRIDRVSLFIHGADPLMFMHDFYFDENDNLIICARFQNKFVMANVIQFVWYWGYVSSDALGLA